MIDALAHAESVLQCTCRRYGIPDLAAFMAVIGMLSLTAVGL